jgi:hypothetical protein
MSVRSDTANTYTFPVWTGSGAALFPGKTQCFCSFWLKVGTWPTGQDNIVGFARSDSSTGGWVFIANNGNDFLGLAGFGSGSGAITSAIAAPIAGQGWIHCAAWMNLHSGANVARGYKNGTIDAAGTGQAGNMLLSTASDIFLFSSDSDIKVAEMALWLASDGSLTSGVAQTLATALAAGASPTATTPVATWYAPCLSDLVNVIG